MDRASLKEQAKKMISGNKWYIWKPMVFFVLLVIAVSLVFGVIFGLLGEDIARVCIAILSVVVGIFSMAFSVAYTHYCLSFVRGQRMEFQDVINYAKEHLGLSVCVGLLTGIFALLGSILFVIPGIIIAIGLTFTEEVLVDNNNLSCMEIIKKSWNLTNGHKMDIFILSLSFIGWLILAELTLGILFIWLTPYMTITFTLAYEELKKTA